MLNKKRNHTVYAVAKLKHTPQKCFVGKRKILYKTYKFYSCFIKLKAKNIQTVMSVSHSVNLLFPIYLVYFQHTFCSLMIMATTFSLKGAKAETETFILSFIPKR